MAAGLLAVAAQGGHAQDLPPLLIGASLPLSGGNAAAGQEGLKAAQAAFDAANRSGGIQGRKLELRALDDGFDPQRAADNARQLAADGVVALFNCWGTSSCNAVVPVANALRVPLVSGIAGGGTMRAEPGRYAFNVRPTTTDEITRMLRQMLTVGQSRIGVAYQDDPFGKSALAAAEAALQKAGAKPRISRALAANGSDAAAAAIELARADINGLILLASPGATIRLVNALRNAGQALPIYNLAAQANRRVVTELGTNTRGVIFTTLVPSPLARCHSAGCATTSRRCGPRAVATSTRTWGWRCSSTPVC